MVQQEPHDDLELDSGAVVQTVKSGLRVRQV